jgi:methyltransferase
MVTGLLIGTGLLAGVGVERLVELRVAARNTRALLARGGVEVGRGHYPAMVAFHAAVLAGCAAQVALRWARALAPGGGPADPWPLGVTLAATAAALGAQALRWWAVSALGPRWTTRIVVLPAAPLVTAGPYRFLRHPNYLAVAIELCALPLAVGAWPTAIAATLGNALLMAVRIPAEERGLRAAAGDRVAPAGRGGPA